MFQVNIILCFLLRHVSTSLCANTLKVTPGKLVLGGLLPALGEHGMALGTVMCRVVLMLMHSSWGREGASAAVACFSHQASTSNAGSALGEAKNWENTMRLSLMQELLSVPIRPICKGHAANFLWSSHPHFFLMQNKKRPPLPCHPEDPAWWAASVPVEQCREDPPPLLPPLCPAWGLMLPPGQETRVLPLPDWTLALQTALLL